MEKIEIKKFKSLKDRNGDPDVFLSHTESFTIISIPEWNWSFLWDVELNDKEAKILCDKALSDPLFPDKRKEFREEIYQYLLYGRV